MKNIVVSLIVMSMLAFLTACGSKTVKAAELTKESMATESGGISSAAEEDGAEPEEAFGSGDVTVTFSLE